MSKIDWSKAPEWAGGHGLVAHHGITEVWISMDQYAVVGSEDRVYPYGGGTGDHRHNFTRGQVQYITPRPARWDGEGLPPVGTVCEVVWPGYYNERFDRFVGKSVTVVAHDVIDSEPVAVFRMAVDGNPEEQDYHALIAKCFRPIRTSEQIAAEEREKAIDTIRQLLSNVACDDFHAAVAIYDAGYRKQAAP